MGSRTSKPASTETSSDSKQSTSASRDDESVCVTAAKPLERSSVTTTTTTITTADTANKANIKSSCISSGSDICWPVTAGIDFGTRSSGFAFVFKDSPDNVHINKWVLGKSEKEKAPAAVLLKEDKSFHSFGYTAETDYAELCDSDEQKGWRYFHLFKMELYRQKKISRKTKLYDAENKPMSAIKVFSIVIGNLKNEILKAIRQQQQDVSDLDVMYVITVPAIWSDAAKQFMREAATSQQAGTPDQQLRLVLEPEAASIYCSRQRVERGDGLEYNPPSVGQVYSIVDIGGGTLDVATHEVVADNRLHEKYVARGNNMGGHYFNKQCLEFLETLFGKDFFREWKTKNCGEFLSLERDIEAMKRKVGKRECDLKLKFCISLLEQHKASSRGKGIEITGLNKEADNVIININDGYIKLKNAFIQGVLKQIAGAIEEQLTAIINAHPSVKLLFLVGGLAKSPFIRKYTEFRFRYCTVIVPKDPGLVVLKVAVLLGNRPQTIAGRIARYSYGIGTTADFVPGCHKEEHRHIAEGKDLCYDLFEKLITKDQVLQFGQKFTTTTIVNAKSLETNGKILKPTSTNQPKHRQCTSRIKDAPNSGDFVYTHLREAGLMVVNLTLS